MLLLLFPTKHLKKYRKDLNRILWKTISGGMDKKLLTPLETVEEELSEEASLKSALKSYFIKTKRFSQK